MPHAYISGQIVECMATSDNVVRAGLTPKLRYTAELINTSVEKLCKKDRCRKRYLTPCRIYDKTSPKCKGLDKSLVPIIAVSLPFMTLPGVENREEGAFHL